MHGLCNCFPFIANEGAKIWEVWHPHPINETMLVCRVIGNVHTVASVYWCVVGGEYELGVYAEGGSYSLCMLGVYTHVGGGGGENVIWCIR